MSKVHVLDDNRNPTGPVLCGRTATLVLGNQLRKGDQICHPCAIALLGRLNDYADMMDRLSGLVAAQQRTIRYHDRLMDALLPEPEPDGDEPGAEAEEAETRRQPGSERVSAHPEPTEEPESPEPESP